MALPEENWEAVSKMLEEPFSDEMEDSNSPAFIAVKLVEENSFNDQLEHTCEANISCTESVTNPTDEQKPMSSNLTDRQQLSDSDSDSDMNVPLAELIEKEHLKSKRSLFQPNESESEPELDDDVRDPTFKIQKKDLNTSDSDTDSYEIKFIKRGEKMKRKPKVAKEQNSKNSSRDKSWKRKPTSLSRRKRLTPGRPSAASRHIHRALERAKKESYNIHRVRSELREKHRQNLDALLASNGLQRKVVRGDGNCLFKAVHMSTNECPTPEILRQKLCNHLCENQQAYIEFLACGEHLSNNEKVDMYIEKINFLRDEGHWSNDLADAMPLAIANMFGRTLKIYCSNRANPVYEIQPNLLPQAREENDVLNLAFFQVPGYEHYDACSKIGENKQIQESPQDATLANQPSTSSEPSETINITPRKQAHYRSPEKFTKKRKRVAQPEKWKKNVRKRRRVHGLEYINTAGKTIPEKFLKDIQCNCRYKCNQNFSYEERNRIFQDYWTLGSYERQKDFLCSNITENIPSRVRTHSRKRRVRSRTYCLDKRRVCKIFFQKTLDVGNRVIDTAMKAQSSGLFTSFDKRGKHTQHNKTPEAKLNKVRQHIESFPRVEAHYTRQDTKRQFLGSDINITKMYSLYRAKCEVDSTRCVSSTMYRKVFCEEYNYSFHVPKKDQCQTCAIYRNKEEAGDLTEDLKLNYQEHIKRKTRAREEKCSDKLRAKQNQFFHVATFDLEAVLPIPCSLVSQVYYKRKLSCYNLSFYSLHNSSSTCFLWNETEGQRGSCEAGTCLLTYIKSLPKTVKHVCFYSDCCAGQNRNRLVAVALMHALEKCHNIEIIEQKFLESGHTQMESDSIHAAIERAKKCTSVYVPSQWDTIVRMARKKNPYVVVPMKHFDFLDIKSVVKSIFPPNAVDIKGQKLQWAKIKLIRFQKDEPGNVYVKYNFDDLQFNCIKLKVSRKGASVKSDLLPLYKAKLPIALAKKKDLLSLCSDGTIPSEFHQYFKDIPSEKSARDCLPEPDTLEESDDSDIE